MEASWEGGGCRVVVISNEIAISVGFFQYLLYRYTRISQCCGSGMFIPDLGNKREG
jgi:hypothetical protein